jgi:midasin
MLDKVKILLKNWPDQSALGGIDIPNFVDSPDNPTVSNLLSHASDDQDMTDSAVPHGAVTEMISLVRILWSSSFSDRKDQLLESPLKRQKLSDGESDNYSQDDRFSSLAPLVAEIEDLSKRHSSLFEWADGPVADAMKSGHFLLLDELSLAEDAVLERINSVLEPSRTLVLAEKGEDVGADSDQDTRFIQAHDNFCIFATMNPGGDYGKRELSPALRSRFTEIWVPAVDDISDIELVLVRSLGAADAAISSNTIVPKMLAYVDWFNNSVCNVAASPFAGLSLSLRDVLAWTQFIVKARELNRDLDLWDAYCHGAALMHLDGLGLGTGLAVEDTLVLRARAQTSLLEQTSTPDGITVFSGEHHNLDFAVSRDLFGVHPFWVPIGQQRIRESSFNFAAPRTAENIYRVLRAMQLPKPILLEGSPGVGKTR